MKPRIVYVDDAAYALERMAAQPQQSSHWLMVACAPKITHRISRWGSRSTLEKWRAKWAKSLFEQLLGRWPSAYGAQVTTIVAEGSVQDLVSELRTQHGEIAVLDLRRPKSPSATQSLVSSGSRLYGIVSTLLGGMGTLLLLDIE